jgi:hypothetical protein
VIIAVFELGEGLPDIATTCIGVFSMFMCTSTMSETLRLLSANPPALPWGNRVKGKKDCFFEKKTAKTVDYFGFGRPGRRKP